MSRSPLVLALAFALLPCAVHAEDPRRAQDQMRRMSGSDRRVACGLGLAIDIERRWSLILAMQPDARAVVNVIT